MAADTPDDSPDDMASDIDALRARLEELAHLRRYEWPRGSHHQVVAGLRSTDRSLRLLALTLAPRDVYEAVAKELQERLDAPDLDEAEAHAVLDAIEGMVGRAAAFDLDVPCNPGAATKARFTSMLARLRTLFHDPNAPGSQRVRAMEVGARGQQAWAIGAARVAWRTEDPMWRRAALRAASWQPGAEWVVEEAVGAQDPLLRALAWHAAARLQLQSVAEASLNAAMDTFRTGLERSAALAAVGAIVPSNSLAILTAGATAFEGDDGLKVSWTEALAQLELED